MKIFFTFLMVTICTCLFSQQYKYTLQLPQNSEEEMIKQWTRDVYFIFDSSPQQQTQNGKYILLSDVDISEEVFSKKMEGLGYERILFTKTETGETLKK